jgi:hypothetical protein
MQKQRLHKENQEEYDVAHGEEILHFERWRRVIVEDEDEDLGGIEFINCVIGYTDWREEMRRILT